MLNQLSILFAIFTTSLLGSLHCVGMCGGFVGIVSASGCRKGDLSIGDNSEPSVSIASVLPETVRPSFVVSNRDFRHGLRVSPLIWYHLGRLISYGTVGAIAGSVGAAFDLTGEYLGLQRFSAILAAVIILCMGLFILFPKLELISQLLSGLPVVRRMFRVGSRPGVGSECGSVTVERVEPERLVQLGNRNKSRVQPSGGRTFIGLGSVYRRVLALDQGSSAQALSLGALSAILPCGWLFSFYVVAAGSGSTIGGTLTMGAFWLGTVPALVMVGLAANWVYRLRAEIKLPGILLPTRLLPARYFNGSTLRLVLNPQKMVACALIAAGLFSLYLHIRPLVSHAAQEHNMPNTQNVEVHRVIEVHRATCH